MIRAHTHPHPTWSIDVALVPEADHQARVTAAVGPLRLCVCTLIPQLMYWHVGFAQPPTVTSGLNAQGDTAAVHFDSVNFRHAHTYLHQVPRVSMPQQVAAPSIPAHAQLTSQS